MRTRFHLSTLVMALLATPAVAGPPFPGDSIVDPCVAFCPAGDIVFRIRGLRNGAPVEGWPIELDLCACPGLRFGSQAGGPYWLISPCRFGTLTSTPGGVAEFALVAGGVCSDAAVTVTSPFLLGTRSAVASTDQNGDLVVDESDADIASTKLGTYDPTMDLDCDGAVTDNDLAILLAHFGHRDNTIAVEMSAWGHVKALFRE